MGEYVTAWFENCRDISSNTRAQREILIRKHITPEIGHKRLSNLTPHDLTTMYRHLATNEREDGKGTLSLRTVAICHSVMHKALKEAVESEILSSNPADRARPMRTTSHEIVPLSEEELGAFLSTADRLESRYVALYVLAVDSGLRLGELLALRWSDVDLEKGTLSVRHTLLRKGHDIEARITETKTGSKGARFIEIDASALAALREHRRQQVQERLALGPKWEDHNLVFANTKGKATTDTQIRSRDMGRIIKEAGMRHFRPHDLRHTSATMLLGEGVQAKVI
nr:tyrosine-type recombinase/integrase [Thermaerobacter sp.]